MKNGNHRKIYSQMRGVHLCKKTLAAMLAAGCLLCVLGGCGRGEIKQPGSLAGTEQALENKVRQLTAPSQGTADAQDLPVSGEETDLLAEGVNQFGLELFARLDQSENQFFSPYSISSALSILDNGAGGQTKAEIETMLGIADLSGWNQQMQLFLQKEWSEETKLLTANSLWIDMQSSLSEKLEADFLAPVSFYYNGEVFQADFSKDGENLVKRINAWVEEHTDGMIKDFKKEVDPDTTMSIINAVFFEGKWEYPFEGEDTQADGRFRNGKGQWERDVPMMNQWDVRLRYFETEQFQGVELPYKDSSLVMDILLPGREYDLSAYHGLDRQEQAALWQSFDLSREEEVETLSMPAFTMDITVEDMPGILQDLGMVSAFGPDADLDRIGPEKYVQDVAHRARIEVCEEGTRAAAVTEIVTADGAAIEISDRIEFIVDRPFVYAIRDRNTGMILFLGQVVSLASQ